MSQIMSTEQEMVVIPLDSALYEEAEPVFAEMGLPINEAVGLFVKQTLIRGALPFRIRAKKPNARTLAAIAEAGQLLNDPNARPTASAFNSAGPVTVRQIHPNVIVVG